MVEECVRYFCKFDGFEDQLPVIWHQSLLTLVTSYKRKLRFAYSDDDKNCGNLRDYVVADQWLSLSDGLIAVANMTY